MEKELYDALHALLSALTTADNYFACPICRWDRGGHDPNRPCGRVIALLADVPITKEGLNATIIYKAEIPAERMRESIVIVEPDEYK